jgi:iron complex outermembrane recepter protein
MADTVRGVITSADGGNLPRMSPSRIGGKLTWRGGENNRWSADAGATHVFKQDRVASFETSTAGFTRIDASLRYRWAYSTQQNADLYLLGKNLSNRDLRAHTSFLKDVAPLPGRSVFVGLSVAY